MEKKFSLFGAAQHLGRSLMLPVAVLPVAALLLRFGVLFNLNFMTAAGAAVFDNLALLFGIGVAVGIAFDGNGAAALAGAVAHFVILKGAQVINETINMGVLSGILGGILAGVLYNKFYNIKLPSWLGFFAGRRFVPIITGLISILFAAFFGYVWPYVQSGLGALTGGIASLGIVGFFIFGTLNRLLIPLGLHPVLYSFFWFQYGDYTGADGKVVNGDLTRFFAGDPTAGGFMTGFFPIMMFALPAAALAMYLLAKKERKAATAGVLFSVAFTAFLTGITEPLEFLFMFLAPALYVIHALLTGLALAVTAALGMKLGFGFSAGLIDYIVNWNLATKPLLLIPVGIAFGALYFFIFLFAIKAFNLKTIGREDSLETAAAPASGRAPAHSASEEARLFADALGGVANLSNVFFCVTRLRVEVIDGDKINDEALKQLGARGIVRPSKSTVQVILGQKAEVISDAINAMRRSK